MGLAGLDSKRAWDMREKLLQQGADKGWVAYGLAGLDSERAWDMREKLLRQGADKGRVAMGLAGLDSERAWDMREAFLKDETDEETLARMAIIYAGMAMVGVRKARADAESNR